MPEEYRSRSLTLIHAFYNFATVVALVLTPVLIQAVGWPSALRLFSAAGLAWAVRHALLLLHCRCHARHHTWLQGTYNAAVRLESWASTRFLILLESPGGLFCACTCPWHVVFLFCAPHLAFEFHVFLIEHEVAKIINI